MMDVLAGHAVGCLREPARAGGLGTARRLVTADAVAGGLVPSVS